MDLSKKSNLDFLLSIGQFGCPLKQYLPSVNDLNIYDCAQHARGNVQANFKYDVFGNERKKPIASEGAHIQPHSVPCHRFFWRIIAARLGLDVNSALDRRRLEMFYYGRVLKQSVNARKIPNSGFLNSPLNLIALQLQKPFFDDDPSIMFIPLSTSAIELWAWDALSEMDYIVICDEALTYRLLGACHIEQEVISSEDPRVAQSFENYGQIMSAVIALLLQDNIDDAPEECYVRFYLKRLQDQMRFPSPVLRPGVKGEFLKITFGRAKLNPEEPWKNWKRHPSPDPISLICRSFNAFLTHLYKTGQLGVTTRDYSSFKLFPSCLDYPGEPDCNLCIANSLLYGPGYSYLDFDDRAYLFSIVRLEDSGDRPRCRRIWRVVMRRVNE